MTTQEKQMIDGSLIVIAQKFEILPKSNKNRTSEKRFVATSKRAELRSHVDLMNNMYKEHGGACYYEIDEEATLKYFNKKSTSKDDDKEAELATLRANYKDKFGKEAKKTWGVKKLTEALSE